MRATSARTQPVFNFYVAELDSDWATVETIVTSPQQNWRIVERPVERDYIFPSDTRPGSAYYDCKAHADLRQCQSRENLDAYMRARGGGNILTLLRAQVYGMSGGSESARQRLATVLDTYDP